MKTQIKYFIFLLTFFTGCFTASINTVSANSDATGCIGSSSLFLSGHMAGQACFPGYITQEWGTCEVNVCTTLLPSWLRRGACTETVRVRCLKNNPPSVCPSCSPPPPQYTHYNAGAWSACSTRGCSPWDGATRVCWGTKTRNITAYLSYAAPNESRPSDSSTCNNVETRPSYTYYNTSAWGSCNGSWSSWNSATKSRTYSGSQSRSVTPYTAYVAPNQARPSGNQGCSSTEYDYSAPSLSKSWPQAQIGQNTILSITAHDNISMGGGSLTVIQNNSYFNIYPAIIAGANATVAIEVKAQYLNNIFTTRFTVNARDHVGNISSIAYDVIYDGVAPFINVSQNNQGLVAQGGLTAYADDTSIPVRVASLYEEADITHNYGFWVTFSEEQNVVNANLQTGVSKIRYRYEAGETYYPIEITGAWSAWQSNFFKIPQVNQVPESVSPNNEQTLATYLFIPDSGKILLEMEVEDLAGNITNEIFNIYLDSKPIVQVTPLDWVNPSKGEIINFEVLNKTINNDNIYYPQKNDTYVYELYEYQADAVTLGNKVWTKETKNQLLEVTQGQNSQSDSAPYTDITALSGQKYAVKIYFKNESTQATGDVYSSFVGNVYIDNTNIVQPEELNFHLSVPTNTSAGLATTVPVADACNAVNLQAISKTKFNNASKANVNTTFVKCVPDFSIQDDLVNKKGRDDVVAFNLKQIYGEGVNNKEKINMLVLNTHTPKDTTEVLEDDVVYTDVDVSGTPLYSKEEEVIRVTKGEVSERVKGVYTDDIVSPLVEVLDTNDDNGLEQYVIATNIYEAQKKAVQSSVTKGFQGLEDRKQVTQVKSDEIPTINIQQNTAVSAFNETVYALERVADNNKKLIALINKNEQAIRYNDVEIEKYVENNEELNEKINNKKFEKLEIESKYKDLKAAIDVLDQTLLTYAPVTLEKLLFIQKNIRNTNKKYTEALQNLEDLQISIPNSLDTLEVDQSNFLEYIQGLEEAKINIYKAAQADLQDLVNLQNEYFICKNNQVSRSNNDRKSQFSSYFNQSSCDKLAGAKVEFTSAENTIIQKKGLEDLNVFSTWFLKFKNTKELDKINVSIRVANNNLNTLINNKNSLELKQNGLAQEIEEKRVAQENEITLLRADETEILRKLQEKTIFENQKSGYLKNQEDLMKELAFIDDELANFDQELIGLSAFEEVGKLVNNKAVLIKTKTRDLQKEQRNNQSRVRIENRLYKIGNDLHKSEIEIQAEIERIFPTNKGDQASLPQENSFLKDVLHAVLGIQDTYAVGLEEGVYLLPSGEQIIVDLTAPTGEVSGYQYGANGSKNPITSWWWKPIYQQILGLKKNDNFEEYGSFKSWKVEGKKGTHPKDLVTTCSNFGAYQLIDSGVDYGPATVLDTDIIANNNWGECFEYRLSLEDESGNISEFHTDSIYADGIQPTLKTLSITSADGTDLISNICDPTDEACVTVGAWTNQKTVFDWTFTDGEAGMNMLEIEIEHNGVSMLSKQSSNSTCNGVECSGSYTIDPVAATGAACETNVSECGNEGVYLITLIATDKASITYTRKFKLQYDVTDPKITAFESDHFEDAIGGVHDIIASEPTRYWQLAGKGNEEPGASGDNLWTLGFDDLDNGNASSTTNKDYVAQISPDQFEIKVFACTDLDENTCNSPSTLLTTVKADGTLTNANPSWLEVLPLTNMSRNEATTFSTSTFEFKKSKAYNADGTINFNGKYLISYSITDDAGNNTTFKRIVNITPNQLDATNASLALAANCNNTTWKANAKDTCAVSVALKDRYNNALSNRSKVSIQGHSDTALDQIHYPDINVVGVGSDIAKDKQESLFFVNLDSSVDTEEAGIRVANQEYTSDTQGEFSFNLVAYAPGTGAIDFITSTQEHAALQYKTDTYSGVYSVQDAENNHAYTITNQYNFTWQEKPKFFQKNATTEFTVNVTNNLGSDALNERLSLYVHDKLNGAYTVENMDTAAPVTELKTAFVINGTTNEQTNAKIELSIESDAYDASSIYAQENLGTGLYTYKVRFVKNAGVQSFDTTVDIEPFVFMDIERDGNTKNVSYSFLSQEIVDIPLYNQATEMTGSGLVQSTAGQSSQATGTDAAADSLGANSVQAITSYVKEKVKKEILDLANNGASVSITSLTNYGNAQLINNAQTYVVKGDGKDLIINGDGDLFQFGDKPVAFVTYGGDIIIKSNMIFTGLKKPTIAFISLQNKETGKGGEIRIYNETSNGNELTNILGSYFSEKGTLAIDANATNLVDMTPEERQNYMTHQLVLEGSVMGGNTLGGGDVDASGNYSCPSFIRQSSCGEVNAQKYDLNYLRRYVPGQVLTHIAANNNGGSTKPVIIHYYVNKELLPDELK